MNLTPPQIKYIDDYLKYHKVNYWDIRIELLDHIVSKVEALMEHGKTFESALEEVHVGFGNTLTCYYNSNLQYDIFGRGHAYQELIDNKRIQLKKQYKKTVWNEIKNLWATFQGIALMLFFLMFNFYLLQNFPKKSTYILLFALAISPMIYTYLLAIKFWYLRKKEKILHSEMALEIAVFVMSYTYLTLNTTPYFWVFITLNFLFFVYLLAGNRMYFKTYTKYLQLLKKYH
jgi:hypothetical protein